MSGTGSRRPPPAFVEDYDDDAQTTLSSTRETADVALKRSQAALVPVRRSTRIYDGSDSGYSSKAPTVGSASTGAGKMSGLTVDTSLQERERHPYLVSARGNAVRRETLTRPNVVSTGQTPAREQPFVHREGICMTCDHYGQHIDLALSAVQPPTPVSPHVPKKAPTMKSARDGPNPRLKRYSSHQSAPPTSYSQPPAVQPVYSAGPYVQTNEWSMPTTPMVYTYATPLTSTYVGPTSQTSYFDQAPTSETRPPNPTRRSSQYGDPVIQQAMREDKGAADVETSRLKGGQPAHASHRSRDYGSRRSPFVARDYDSRPSTSITRDYDSRPSTSITRDYDPRPSDSITRNYDGRPAASISQDYNERPTTFVERDYDTLPLTAAQHDSDRRPQMSAHRSTQSINRDRVAMPPPEKPSRQPGVSRRPSLRKSSTDNPEVGNHRHFGIAGEYEHVGQRVPPSPKTRAAPPSSYRGLQAPDETQSRPRPTRKSASYADPVSDTKVSQNKAESSSDSYPRRNANPPTSMDQMAADAEAYQRSRSNMTSEELTAERLNALKKQRSNTLSSETGSAYSHKESHHSSSVGSSGRGRSHTSAHRTSILIDKGIKVDVPANYERKGRPVSIDLGGGMTLSFGSKDKDKKKEPKMIERAPSVASHASKKSTSSASHDLPSRSREYNESSRSSRRPSHNDERMQPVTDQSHRSSHLHSRAPSTTRAGRRQSAEYTSGYSGW